VLRKIIDSPWLYFSLAGVLLVLMVVLQFDRVASEASEGSAHDLRTMADRDHVNVVFIVIDTLRADRVHAWGYARETSPHIDALAQRGVRFANVEAQSSWTKASMASLWTAMYPQRTGVLSFSHAIPPEAMLPAEIFQEAGYRTAGIWRNGWVANNFGFDQGFDLYYRPMKNRPVKQVRRHNPSAHPLQGTDLDATESALEFIVGVGDDPFLLYIHYMDVHQYLYASTSPEYGSSFSDIYDSAIHWTDRNIGSVVDGLRNRGLLDDTMIVIATDHGEAFFEHGREGHARDLYREVQHVPLIIAPPFTLRPGLVVEERVANVDIWPTILDLIGLPPLTGAQGRSLVPLMLAAGGIGEVPGDLRGRPLFAQIDRSWGRQGVDSNPMISVVRDDYRMLHQTLRPMQRELYDHSVDPNEQANLASTRDEVEKSLQAEIDALLLMSPEWGAAPEIEIDEMHRAQLRALGYSLPATERKNRQKERNKAAVERRAAAAGHVEEP
jgi:arylsulfatase A-like enzyme